MAVFLLYCDIYIYMISLVKIVRELLAEAMTFKDLMASAGTDAGRLERSKGMRVKSLRPVFDDDGEFMIFSYKSSPATSTTKKRYQGYIKLSNADLKSNKSKDDINCIVDCQCPDFKYRFAYWDSKEKASITGKDSWNKNNGATPKKYGKRIGLCKHLISLAGYLQTTIDAVQPLKENIYSSLNTIFPENKEFTIDICEGAAIDKLTNDIKKLENEFDRLDSQGMTTLHITKELEKLRKQLVRWEKLNKATD
jgi:hypothetical protein